MFFRTKPAGSYRYLQIVHSVREGKNVRQQVIATLGRLDLLEASGQLERLMRSGLRHCQSLAVLDAHAAGQMQPVAIRRIGPDLVFARLWKESGIQEVLRSVLKARQYEFDVERAIYLTVLHRLFAAGSDRAAERWREQYRIPETEKLDLVVSNCSNFDSSGFSGGFFTDRNRPPRALPVPSSIPKHFDDPEKPDKMAVTTDQSATRATRLNEPGSTASHSARGPGGKPTETRGFSGSGHREGDFGQCFIPRKTLKSPNFP